MSPTTRTEATLETEQPSRSIRLVEYPDNRLELIEDRDSPINDHVTITISEAEHLVGVAGDVRERDGVFVLDKSPVAGETYLVARSDQQYRVVSDGTEITLAGTGFDSLVSTLLQWEHHPVEPAQVPESESSQES